MPVKENLCPKHGPYPATLGSCPYCGSGEVSRPKRPNPLDAEDDLPADLSGAHGGPFRDSEDDLPTNIPCSPRNQRLLDRNDEEETNLGHFGRDVTETQLDAPKPGGAEAILWVREGLRRGRIYKIKGDMVIGRKDGDLILDDPKVSNPHAKITCEDGIFTIWDFGSKNGTFVNGERIRAATPLKENDLVKMGDMVFVIKVLG